MPGTLKFLRSALPEQNCRLAEDIRKTMLSKYYIVTNWYATLKLEWIGPNRKIITVSDPSAVDAGTDISVDDIKLLIRIKK